jgi:hypothetical protein
MEKYKLFDSGDIFKGFTKTTSAAKTAFGGTAASGAGATDTLTWYLVDRTISQWNTDDLKNLFFSLGLARENSGATWSISPDWIDLYRGERMLIATIPQTGCSSYIDGSTLQVRVPTGVNSSDFVTFYGSSYRGHIDTQTNYMLSESWDDSVYGSATIYLFPDRMWGADEYGIHPFTGAIGGKPNPNSGAASWTAANILNASFYPNLRATHWNRNPDGGRDYPYGIAFLEKGIFVFFDTPGRRNFLLPHLTASTMWTSAGTLFAAVTVTGGTEAPNTSTTNRNAIRFTGTNAYTSSRVTYRNLTTSYKLVYFCHAGQAEFNSTINHTYDHKKAYYRPEEADSIYVTEVGLYDDNNVLVAYGKLSEPVAKNVLETLTLKVEINL